MSAVVHGRVQEYRSRLTPKTRKCGCDGALAGADCHGSRGRPARACTYVTASHRPCLKQGLAHGGEGNTAGGRCQAWTSFFFFFWAQAAAFDQAAKPANGQTTPSNPPSQPARLWFTRLVCTASSPSIDGQRWAPCTRHRGQVGAGQARCLGGVDRACMVYMCLVCGCPCKASDDVGLAATSLISAQLCCRLLAPG